MSFFNGTQEALAAGRHVVLARLVEFDFTEAPFRVWLGAGDISIDSKTWSGVGALGSISDAAFGIGDAAGNVTYTLSGVSDAVINSAQKQASEIRGRDVFQYGRFLDVDTLQPLDSSFVIRADIMDTLTYVGSGPEGRTVSLTCETIWTARNAASYATYSDKDQQARFSGDKGCERVLLYRRGVVRRWPTF